MKRLALLIFFFFFLFPQKASAAFNFYIYDINPTTVSLGNQEISVRLKITDLPSESYFRVALQKPTGGSYFGFVQNNNGDWTKIQSLSSDQCILYYHVTDLSTTDLTLKFKIGDDATIDQTNYKLKAHRFTKSCTSYTEATNSADMVLSFPTSTPTSAPSSATSNFSPTKTPTPSASSINVSLTPKVTSKASVKSASTENLAKNKSSSTLSAKRVFNVSTPSPTEETLVSGVNESNSMKNRFVLLFTLSVGGILFIIAAGILMKKYRSEITQWINS